MAVTLVLMVLLVLEEVGEEIIYQELTVRIIEAKTAAPAAGGLITLQRVVLLFTELILGIKLRDRL
jgi:hypothetical protein